MKKKMEKEKKKGKAFLVAGQNLYNPPGISFMGILKFKLINFSKRNNID